VTDLPTWVLLVLRIASGSQYTRGTPKGENHIAGKAQIGVKVTLPSSLFLQSFFLFELLRFPPPVPLIQPPPPQLPRWRPIEIDFRLRSFRFIHSNIIQLAEPDQPTERSPKRRRLNQPLFPPLSHPYCQPTDPFQAVIKPEED
jgi:hypothetical protein